MYNIYIFEFYFVWVIAFLSVWLQDFDFCSLVFELLSGTMSIGSYAISTSVCSIHLFLSFFLCSIHQRDPPNLWYWILVWEVDVMVLFSFFLVDAACFQICTSSQFVVETACDTQITVRCLICMYIPVWWSWTIFSIVWTPEREKNFVLNASCSQFFSSRSNRRSLEIQGTALGKCLRV